MHACIWVTRWWWCCCERAPIHLINVLQRRARVHPTMISALNVVRARVCALIPVYINNHNTPISHQRQHRTQQHLFADFARISSRHQASESVQNPRAVKETFWHMRYQIYILCRCLRPHRHQQVANNFFVKHIHRRGRRTLRPRHICSVHKGGVMCREKKCSYNHTLNWWFIVWNKLCCLRFVRLRGLFGERTRAAAMWNF